MLNVIVLIPFGCVVCHIYPNEYGPSHLSRRATAQAHKWGMSYKPSTCNVRYEMYRIYQSKNCLVVVRLNIWKISIEFVKVKCVFNKTDSKYVISISLSTSISLSSSLFLSPPLSLYLSSPSHPSLSLSLSLPPLSPPSLSPPSLLPPSLFFNNLNISAVFESPG